MEALGLLLAALLAAPAAAAPLKALTLNAAGIPVVQPHWRARRDEIARRIKQRGYDVVALQEVWLDRDAARLARDSGLPHAWRLSKAIGPATGLLILSRYPIKEAHSTVFSCRPPLMKLHQGDALARKGALMARLQTPDGELDVYTAHLVSDYPGDKYRSVRLTQIFELSEMVRGLSAGRPYVILGDFNTDAGNPDHALLLELLGLKDSCWDEKLGRDACGATYAGLRLDYVLHPPDGRVAAETHAAFSEKTSGGYDVSDHLGLESALTLRPAASPVRRSPAARAAALEEVRATLQRMISAMNDRALRRSWIPLYGFIHSAWYRREVLRMEAVKERVITEKMLAGKGDRRR